MIVTDRARKDYGDLTSLIESMRELKLIQPIVLAPGNQLLCGGRRLEAARQLGWIKIPFRRAEMQMDAISLLKAERDENTCRKEMTPSELVALGLRIEALEAPKAKERQGTRNDLATSGSLEPEVARKARTSDVAAEAVGLSGPTYKRAKRLVMAKLASHRPM